MNNLSKEELFLIKKEFYTEIINGHWTSQELRESGFLDKVTVIFPDLKDATHSQEFNRELRVIYQELSEGGEFKDLLIQIGAAKRLSDDIRMLLIQCLYEILRVEKEEIIALMPLDYEAKEVDQE
jgi:hypothetical protein